MSSERWSLLFHEPSSLKTVVSSLVGVQSRAEFQVKKLQKEGGVRCTYLCVDITDLSRVCCVSSRLCVDETKNVDESISFVLDLKEMLTALKCMQQRFTIEISGKKNGTVIDIRGFDSNDSSRDTVCSLNTRIAEETNFRPPLFDYTFQLEIDLNMLKDTLNHGKAMSAELVKLQVYTESCSSKHTKCATRFICEGSSTITDTMRCITEEDEDGSIRIKSADDVDNFPLLENMTNIYQGTFTSTNLQNFVIALPGPPKSKLIANISKNMPLSLTYLLGDEVNKSYIKLLIAPRNMDDEEENEDMED